MSLILGREWNQGVRASHIGNCRSDWKREGREGGGVVRVVSPRRRRGPCKGHSRTVVRTRPIGSAGREFKVEFAVTEASESPGRVDSIGETVSRDETKPMSWGLHKTNNR